jgi:hypothetical protein
VLPDWSRLWRSVQTVTLVLKGVMVGTDSGGGRGVRHHRVYRSSVFAADDDGLHRL